MHRNPATLSHTPSRDQEINIFEEIPLPFVLNCLKVYNIRVTEKISGEFLTSGVQPL